MNRTPRWEWIWLGGIIALAVAIRCWFVAGHQYIFDDSKDYLALARSILAGQEYQVHGLYASRMPGYPILLAGLLWLRPSFAFILYAQAVMGGLCCGVLYLIGRRLSPWIGLTGAALLALDPLQIGFCAAVLSEIPFTLALLIGLWLLTRMLTDRRLWWWLVLGFVWGVAIYLRASALWLIWPLGLTVATVWIMQGTREGERKWHVALGRGLLGLALAWVVVLGMLYPWNTRNTARFGPHRWLTTLEGISLYEAVYPEADGGPRQDKLIVPPAIAARVGEQAEAERNEDWMALSKEYVRQDPGRMLRLAAVKIGRTWSPRFHAGQEGGQDAGFQNSRVQGVLLCWSILTYALAAFGLAAQWQGHCALVGESKLRARCPCRYIVLILLPIVYFTLLHAIFIGSVRYRVPVLPVVDLLAGIGTIGLWQVVRRGWNAKSMK
ncbi:MAG: glycosyltransferase family 39 protein [Phycisphaerae bacterium]